MRARAFGLFFAGFAAGVLFLAALFWATGKLQPIKASAMPQARQVNQADRSVQPAPPPRVVPAPAPAPAPSNPAPEPPSTQPFLTAAEKLIIPVQGVTSPDLRDNFDETHNGHRHEALDIMAERGTPVLAAVEGNVIKLFTSKEGGLTVYQFDDGRAYCFYYAHLDRYAPGLKEGTLLRQGGVLGYVGTTGDAPPDAPHLHFAIFRLGSEKHWWEGTAIDPYPFLTGQRALLR